MLSSWFLTGCCEIISSKGKLGEKRGSLPLPQRKRPILGRKLARSTVRRITMLPLYYVFGI